MLPEQDKLLDELFQAYYLLLKRYARAQLRDEHRAEEVVQDTFHEAVNHIDTLMTHPQPKFWLLKTLKYKIMHSERDRARDLRRFLSLESADDISLTEPDHLEELISEEQNNINDTLEIIKNRLTSEELQHLKRLTLDKASHLEVAEELGITVWTSQKRLERIRNKLRKIFPNR